MKRLFVFIVVFIGLIIISVSAFCQPTGVAGKWEFPGDVNIPTGSNFTINGTPVGGSTYNCDSVNDCETDPQFQASQASLLSEVLSLLYWTDGTTTQQISIAAYGDMGRTSSVTLELAPETYKTVTGLANSGVQLLTEEQGDTCIKISVGGAGVYKISYMGDWEAVEAHFYIYLVVNSTVITLTKSETIDDDVVPGHIPMAGHALVSLAEKDIVRLRIYNYSAVATQSATINWVNVIIERL